MLQNAYLDLIRWRKHQASATSALVTYRLMEFKHNGPSIVNFEITLVEFGHCSVDELFARSPFDQPSYRCASRFQTEEKEKFHQCNLKIYSHRDRRWPLSKRPVQEAPQPCVLRWRWQTGEQATSVQAQRSRAVSTARSPRRNTVGEAVPPQPHGREARGYGFSGRDRSMYLVHLHSV